MGHQGLESRIIVSVHFDDFLYCPLECFSAFKPVDIGPQLWILLLGEPGTSPGCSKGKAHQDVGTCQIFAAEEVSIVRGCRDLALQEFEVGLEIRG